jgi:hypothetical protein
MWEYAARVAISAVVIVLVAEIAKRNSFWAAALASLPLTSLLAFVWLYLDTNDTERVAALARGIFWLVLPSLVLFLALPALLRAGLSFWPSLIASAVATAAAYGLMVVTLSRAGIQL